MRHARIYAVLLYLAGTSLAHNGTSAGPVLALGPLVAMVVVWRKREKRPRLSRARPRTRQRRPQAARSSPPAEPAPLVLELDARRLAEIEEVRLGWLRSVVETRLANREQVEAALHEAYAFAGLQAPGIRWAASPAELVRLTRSLEPVQEPVRRAFRAFVPVDRLPAPCELDRYVDGRWMWTTTAGRIVDQTFGPAPRWSTMGAVRAAIGGTVAPVPTTAESMIAQVAKAEFISASSWLALGPWRPLVTLAREPWGYVLGERTAYVCERHAAINLDGDDRLHSEEGPAIEWADGFAVHAWHGRHVPRDLFERRASITYQEILGESSVSRRELLIELHGYDRLVEDGPSMLVDDDPCGRLWQVPLHGSEAVTLVEVLNATVEPAGGRRRFFLRVPPGTRTAREAVAWTFGLSEDQWSVAAES